MEFSKFFFKYWLKETAPSLFNSQSLFPRNNWLDSKYLVNMPDYKEIYILLKKKLDWNNIAPENEVVKESLKCQRNNGFILIPIKMPKVSMQDYLKKINTIFDSIAFFFWIQKSLCLNIFKFSCDTSITDFWATPVTFRWSFFSLPKADS